MYPLVFWPLGANARERPALCSACVVCLWRNLKRERNEQLKQTLMHTEKYGTSNDLQVVVGRYVVKESLPIRVAQICGTSK